MKNLIKSAAVLLLAGVAAHGQLIVADNYDVTGSGTGFGLGSGVNSGINPPTTRLTGSAAANLRYIQTVTGKTSTAYTITGNKLQTSFSPNSGRFTLSADGTTAFDFSSALTSVSATPAKPAIYDIGISMVNANSGTTRFSFGFGTQEANVDVLDFALQLWRTNSTVNQNRYTIQKRIDTASSGVADINDNITRLAAGTYGTEVNFLIHVTDAGAESTAYNSRVQVSMDGGTSWFYDTSTDTALSNGWRFDASSRFFTWDQAGGNASGQVTYDNFSVNLLTPAPEPSTLALGLMAGVVALIWRRRR
jgi:hypothetical protein